MKCPKSTEIEIEKANLAKDMHLGTVINQQRAVKNYTVEYINSLYLPCQPSNLLDYTYSGCDERKKEQQIEKNFIELFVENQQVTEFKGNVCELNDIIQDCEDSSPPLIAIHNYKALVLADDYDQGNIMPHFGIDRL